MQDVTARGNFVQEKYKKIKAYIQQTCLVRTCSEKVFLNSRLKGL